MTTVTKAAQVDMVSDILGDPCTVRLYTNDLGDEPTAADFQEPEGAGYLAKPMRFAAWDLSNAPELATYPQQIWTFTGPLPDAVQGFYVTRNSDGHLRWYDQLSGGPQRIVNDGDQIKIIVEFEFADADDDDADELAGQ